MSSRSNFRAYVIDATTGREMEDSPYNGATWYGSGAFATIENEDGTISAVRGTTMFVDVAFWNGERMERKTLTASDFDRRVAIKVWRADMGREFVDFRVLAHGDPTTSASHRPATAGPLDAGDYFPAIRSRMRMVA